MSFSCPVLGSVQSLYCGSMKFVSTRSLHILQCRCTVGRGEERGVEGSVGRGGGGGEGVSDEHTHKLEKTTRI